VANAPLVEVTEARENSIGSQAILGDRPASGLVVQARKSQRRLSQMLEKPDLTVARAYG